MVETVCVVVVVWAYILCSPELASDREDSDTLEDGIPSDVVECSPYAGGAPQAENVDKRFGSSKLI